MEEDDEDDDDDDDDDEEEEEEVWDSVIDAIVRIYKQTTIRESARCRDVRGVRVFHCHE